VALRCLRHGPPPLRGRSICPLLAVGVSGSQRVLHCIRTAGRVCTNLVNGARHDVSGAHATVSGTLARREHVFESCDGLVGMSNGFAPGVRSSLTTCV
jgi:hypothetical protein